MQPWKFAWSLTSKNTHTHKKNSWKIGARWTNRAHRTCQWCTQERQRLGRPHKLSWQRGSLAAERLLGESEASGCPADTHLCPASKASYEGCQALDADTVSAPDLSLQGDLLPDASDCLRLRLASRTWDLGWTYTQCAVQPQFDKWWSRAAMLSACLWEGGFPPSCHPQQHCPTLPPHRHCSSGSSAPSERKASSWAGTGHRARAPTQPQQGRCLQGEQIEGLYMLKVYPYQHLQSTQNS